ncbi:MAG: Ig-like domain-containing protein, partial [Cyclobacteriaceae bacterium]|nr:Ig-like domain-containing protein [Cyclobacteriaceae bacterium]
MIKHFLYIISVIIIYQLFNGCAQQSAPSGGPRDTIPPVRLLSIPLDKNTDFHGKTIEMEYDERLKIAKIKEQLIITPLTESDYEYKLKKNKFFITFEEDFQDSTTYTLNFREAIQDITEGNPTKDNKFTFSTGSYIDSLSMKGYVKELLTYDTIENVLVGIYRAEDTVTIFDGSPYYFTELDEHGEYLIENIKNGKYLLYAFFDENKNLKLETNSEPYGFVKDTILLDSGIISRNIDLIRLDLSEFRMMSSVASGQYYDINFNKYITDYHVLPLNSSHQLFTNRAKENKSIRFYNNFTNIDSLQITFTAIDSINTQITDTVYVLFKESKRKKEDFMMSVDPENKSSIEKILDVKIEFNKPIIAIKT